jgi:hypothetical protein
MDDSQKQKSLIDYEAEKAKKEVDRVAAVDRQLLADQEIKRVWDEAKERVRQIQRDAQN